MVKGDRKVRLLPRYFNKVAIILFVLVLIFAGLSLLNILPIDKSILKELTKEGVLLTLLILALTRSKVEDELTLRIRVVSYASAFFFGVARAILNPIINLLFGGPFHSDTRTDELLVSMLLFYFVIFYFLKRGR